MDMPLERGRSIVEMSVEFLFEQVGAAFGIANVFSGVAAGTELNGDSTALEGGT